MIFKGGHKSFITDSYSRVISIQTVRAHETTGNEHGFYDALYLCLTLNGIHHAKKENKVCEIIMKYRSKAVLDTNRLK
jgi:hypothetical protein